MGDNNVCYKLEKEITWGNMLTKGNDLREYATKGNNLRLYAVKGDKLRLSMLQTEIIWDN